MKRNKIIRIVGETFLTSNIENDEFSYKQALKNIGKNIEDYFDSAWKRKYQNVDIRFADERLTIIIETKDNFDDDLIQSMEQLAAYVKYEQELTQNKIIAILANTNDDRIKVFFGDPITIDIANVKTSERAIKTFEEYSNIYFAKTNNKIKILQNTYDLNELLNQLGIKTTIRSQFVGTCLLALKNNLIFKGLTNPQIRSGIEGVLTSLLDKDLNKATKLSILKTKILDSQDIRDLTSVKFQQILLFINEKILPYINDKSTQGQDLLNLFFTTFNKYVGKDDKNQAFTPDHIVQFMCKITGVNRNSYILDPCCGSGAFLVRALTEAMDDCDTEKEKDEIKKHHIFGIEYEEGAFGLSTTNMLIHLDGNSNIVQGSCFNVLDECIKDAPINIVLMNPPYNATEKQSLREYSKHWNLKTKTDPSKGFHFVEYVANKINRGKLAVLLPMACAIGDKEINKYKQLMLQHHHLDAVFSLPGDIFYPGSGSKACCMVFDLGVRHEKSLIKETFFGYFKNDGFVKKKNLGRVEKTNDNGIGLWKDIESLWLDAYTFRKNIPGLSVVKQVTADDEWLAEAYMDTDYSVLTKSNFESKIRDYLAFLCITGKTNLVAQRLDKIKVDLDINSWQSFQIGGKNGIFEIVPAKGETTDQLIDGDDIPYIAAKNDINGFKKLCKKEEYENWISPGNCIVFIQLGDGSAGYTTYQPYDFIGMNGKISCGYNLNLNKYNALFISVVLDLERPKYSFGRSWTGERLKNTTIKLPVKNGNIDWEYMENFIKSLPLADRL